MFNPMGSNQLERFDTPQFLAGDFNSMQVSSKYNQNMQFNFEQVADQMPEVFQLNQSQASLFDNFERRPDEFDPAMLDLTQNFNQLAIPDFEQTYRSQEFDFDEDNQLDNFTFKQAQQEYFDQNLNQFALAASDLSSDILNQFIYS